MQSGTIGGVDIRTLRREKLEKLITSRGGILQRVATEAGVNERYLSQIRTGHRGMGSAFARRMENGLGLPENWFDSNSDILVSADEISRRVAQMSRDERMLWLQAIAAAELTDHGTDPED